MVCTYFAVFFFKPQAHNTTEELQPLRIKVQKQRQFQHVIHGRFASFEEPNAYSGIPNATADTQILRMGVR